MIPLFCQDKDVQRTISQAVGIGTRQIPTEQAASYFRAGERVFVSKADATEVEYLGTIQTVATDSITVELATQVAHAVGAPLWTPGAVFEWPAGSDGAARRVRRGGVEVVRSLGGEGYATRLHLPYDVESVRFENLTDERFGQLSSWFDIQANGGLQEFTYVDAARVVWRVRLDAPALEWSRNPRNLIVVGFNLHLLSEAKYA
jgi:hypothetical protein